MKIGIDARLIHETGVGRYIANLIDYLGKIDHSNNYIVFLRKVAYESFTLPNNRWEKRLADVPWHSLREQIVMPIVFLREHLDLLHVPYFNIPIFYPRAFVVTMHDIIIYHFNTGRATTLPYLLYKLRRLGYYLTLIWGLARAKKIFAVSKFTKQDLVKCFSIPEKKIDVIYQGIALKVITKNQGKSLIEGDYLLYVGNAYPHKNLALLLNVFNTFYLKKKDKEKVKQWPQLVLVGKEDYFYLKLKDVAQKLPCRKNIIFYGWTNDRELSILYTQAIGFIYPTLMEGFGLPPIEAMVHGTPTLVSDIPVFHEVLGDAPLYFNPKSAEDFFNKIDFLWNNSSKLKKLLPAPIFFLNKYRWEETASATLQGYYASLF